MSNLSFNATANNAKQSQEKPDESLLAKTSNAIARSANHHGNIDDFTKDRSTQKGGCSNAEDLLSSMISFASSVDNELDMAEAVKPSFDLLGPKAEFVYSLSAMLGSNNRAESSQTLLLLSQEKEYNAFFRDAGCLNILIHLMHSNGDITQYRPTAEDLEVSTRCAEALRNTVKYQEDERRRRHEVRLLQQLELLRAFVQKLRMKIGENASAIRYDKEVCVAVALLMKFSFDQEDRRLTLSLGGLQALAETLIIHQFMFGVAADQTTIEFRKNIGMALTNLTFGAAQSKLILCGYPKFLESLNRQIEEDVDDLRLVFASVLRNLSWKADKPSKIALRNSGSVTVLVKACMRVKHENALKTVLSALWNLSSHCSENKADICAEPGILEFLVTLLNNEQRYGTAVLENGGGILRDISSEIALNEEYRSILRRHSCFQILLHHLKSSSLTVVSNACSTLWNLSADSEQDQATLIQHGALQLLSHLVRSRHDMISRSSMATLRNLLIFKHKSTSTRNSLSRSSSAGHKNNEQSCGIAGGIVSKSTISNSGSTNRNNNLLSSASTNQISSSSSINQNLSLSTNQNSSPNRQAPPKSVPVVAHSSLSYLGNSNYQHQGSAPPSGGTGGNVTTRDESEDKDIKVYATEPTPTNASAFSFFRQPDHPPRFGETAAVTRDESEDIKVYATEPTPGASVRSSMSSIFSKCLNDAGSLKDEAVNTENLPYGAPSKVIGQMSIPNSGSHLSKTAAQISNHQPQSPTSENPYPPPQLRSASVSFDPSSSMVNTTATVNTKDSGGKKQSANNECGGYRVVNNNTSDITDATAALSLSANNSKPATVMPTPMMYSRHSSLQSLDSCDQHSVRSTVYSEYSQLPTGMHSPYELPDSPTQTCPPTPHSSKAPPVSGGKFFAVPTEKSILPLNQPEMTIVERTNSVTTCTSSVPVQPIGKASASLQDRHVTNNKQHQERVVFDHLSQSHAAEIDKNEPQSHAINQQPAPQQYHIVDRLKNNVTNNFLMTAEYPALDIAEKPKTYCVETASTISSLSAITVDSGTKIKPTRKQRTNIDDCIYSAMPKPKTPASGTPVGSKFKKINKEAPETACKTNKPELVERTDVDDCIYSVLPKPRKGRQKSGSKIHKSTRHCSANQKPTGFITQNRPFGLTESFDLSGLDSSMESFTIIRSEVDSNNKGNNMQISTSSNLIRMTATLENIKDAASLSAADPAAPQVTKSSSDETNGSLSEDNYSRIEDESFDLNVEDVDVDLLLTNQNQYEDQHDDLTFDVVNMANALTVGSEMVDKCAGGLRNTDEICFNKDEAELKSRHTSTNTAAASATVGSLSTPKLPVRTTKTVELRITRRANESSERLRAGAGGITGDGTGSGASSSPSPFKSGDLETATSNLMTTDPNGRFSRNTSDRRSQKSTGSTSSARSSPNPLSATIVKNVAGHSPVISMKNSPRSKPAIPPKPVTLLPIEQHHGASSKLPCSPHQAELPPTLCVVPPFSYSPSRSPKSMCRTGQRSNAGSTATISVTGQVPAAAAAAAFYGTGGTSTVDQNRPSPTIGSHISARDGTKIFSAAAKPSATPVKTVTAASVEQQNAGDINKEIDNGNGVSSSSKPSPSKRVLVTTV